MRRSFSRDDFCMSCTTGTTSPDRTRAGSELLLALICFSVVLLLQGCTPANDTKVAADASADAATEHAQPPPPPAPRPPRLASAELWNNGKPREVLAAWYDVPEDSLAKRRAGTEEFTAAHNRLPIGTLVRVTHLKNGKSVLVRITDRGINASRIKIDLCKEAAEQLDMVSKGIARVRMEVLAETNGSSLADSQTAAPLR